MIDTCALYGGSTYVSSWLEPSLLIILTAFLIVAILYILSGFFSSSLRSKIREMVKSEVVQLVISVVIIAILLGSAATACNISSSISQSLVKSSLNPIQYSEYYIGNLSMNTGLKLLSYLYTTSIVYGIDARILYVIGNSFDFFQTRAILGASINFGINLSVPYNFLASLYISVFSPILIIVIGMLLLQYILLPLIQYTAFTIVLPVALIVRSIAYIGTSGGLRTAANALIAIAIAFYLIYPLTIGLDSVIVNWLYSPANPTYIYLQQTLQFNQIPSTFLSTTTSTLTGPSAFGLSTQSVSSLLNSASSLGIAHFLNPINIPQEANFIITTMAQFIFVGVFLFALNMGITVAFAMSLSKALDAGIDGAGSFWRGL